MDLTNLSNVPAFRKKEALEKAKKAEAVHSLVLKVIRWKTNNFSLSPDEPKITSSEWKKYCKHITQTNVSMNEKEIKLKLKTTKEAVQKNAGFN